MSTKNTRKEYNTLKEEYNRLKENKNPSLEEKKYIKELKAKMKKVELEHNKLVEQKQVERSSMEAEDIASKKLREEGKSEQRERELMRAESIAGKKLRKKENKSRERALMKAEDIASKKLRAKKNKKPIPKYIEEEEPQSPPQSASERYIDEHDDMKVPLPEMHEDTIAIPKMFIKYGDIRMGDKVVKGWTIDNIGDKAVNKTREISSRKGKKVMKVTSSSVGQVEQITHHAIPRLADFPLLSDRRQLYHYLTHLHPSEEAYPDNLPRGRPPVLPKNWRYHGMGELPQSYKKSTFKKSGAKTDRQRNGEEKKTKSPPKQKHTAEDIDWGNEAEGNEEEQPYNEIENEVEEENLGAGGGRKKGRTRKYGEEKNPKLESNRVKRANREMLKRLYNLSQNAFTEQTDIGVKHSKIDRDAIEKYIGNSREQINNLEKLLSSFNKKEQKDYAEEIKELQDELILSKKQIQGKGVVSKTLKNTLNHLISHVTDPNEPIDKRDFKQSKEIIDTIQKVKRGRGRPKKSEGGDLFSMLNTGAKQVTQGLTKRIDTVKKGISSGVKKGVEVAKNVEQGVKKYTNVVLHGRNDYPPKVRKIIDKYGNDIIKSAVIQRAPVPSLLTGALSAVSLGQFGNNLENAPYDKLFHLSLVLTTEGGVNILLEKNEVINMDTNVRPQKNTESKAVPLNGQVTLNELLEKTKSQMGGKYFGYSARDNNCQDFILAIMTANNIGNEEDKTFVKQDTKQLFKDMPILRKISNTITDLGSKVNEITTGAGVDFEEVKWGTLTALYKRFMKKHPDFKDKIEDLDHFVHFIIENPDKFSKVASKKAHFYLNIIKKGEK